MSQRKLTPLVILLVVVAVVCLLLSVVVQLGESIRYQQAPSGLKITYTAKELAFILGLPITALASLLWASLRSRHPILILLSVPLGALALYHIYLALIRL